MATAPRTLIGLGPPEPPEGFGEDADAPAETLRAWTTSGKGPADDDTGLESFVPLEPLLPRDIFPRSLRGRGALDGPRGRRTIAITPVLWSAAALIAGAALTSMGSHFGDRSPARPGPVAAARSSATTPFVGCPSVSLPGPEVERERPAETSTEEPRPARKARTSPQHPTAVAGASVRPSESGNASTARNEARIQAIAGKVRLEDDAAEPEGREGVEPEEPGSGAR